MITFVGAGSGDPDLITIKGAKKLGEADVVIYAGSLVNPGVLTHAKQGAAIYNSASMTLDEVIEVMAPAAKAGKKVVRLHTGDPSIYGAIREQMDRLDALQLDYEVVPGVSSFVASAAALKKEFTLPNVSQTVIITRQAGRTPMPEGESLHELAAHGATMCIFLSIQMIEDVMRELLAGGAYTKDTPVAIVQKASWPDQKIYRGTIGTIAEIVKADGVDRTAMIMVGGFLGDDYELSRLYAPDFTHGFREAKQV